MSTVREWKLTQGDLSRAPRRARSRLDLARSKDGLLSRDRQGGSVRGMGDVSPLDSPAIGTATDDLILPCPNRDPRPAQPPAPHVPPAFSMAFSGGGFRATLSALGVTRFMAGAGLL